MQKRRQHQAPPPKEGEKPSLVIPAKAEIQKGTTQFWIPGIASVAGDTGG